MMKKSLKPLVLRVETVRNLQTITTLQLAHVAGAIGEESGGNCPLHQKLVATKAGQGIDTVSGANDPAH